jgi:hypothetical protein
MTDHRHASATSHGGATGIVRLHTHHETYMHTHHALLQSQSKAEGGACKRIRRLIQRIPTRLPPLPSAGTLNLSSSPWVPVGIVWLLRCPRFPAGHGVRRLMRGRMRHGAARDALHHMLQGGHSCVKVTSIPTALSLSLSLSATEHSIWRLLRVLRVPADVAITLSKAGRENQDTRRRHPAELDTQQSLTNAWVKALRRSSNREKKRSAHTAKEPYLHGKRDAIAPEDTLEDAAAALGSFSLARPPSFCPPVLCSHAHMPARGELPQEKTHIRQNLAWHGRRFVSEINSLSHPATQPQRA